MVVSIEKSVGYGRVAAPPSKSMAHRYLICAALSGGSTVKGVSLSEDVKATLNCIKALGGKTEIEGDTVNVGGISPENEPTENTLFCNESGSTLRFFIPLCLLFGKQITLTGSDRLFKRSLAVYEDMCRAQGIYFSQNGNLLTVNGKLTAGKYSVRGDISSQFISGLMFALPLLQNDSTIEITGTLESASYLNMTVKALADFGVRISKTDGRTYYIKGGQTYKPRTLTVEGDYSNAAFFEALNTIGGNVSVSGLNAETCQGDAVYKKYFGEITRGCSTIDISDCPDLGPVLMAVAAASDGATLTGTRRLKIKESDRGAAMAEELKKFGCEVTLAENEITVHKCELKAPTLPLYGHNDHRIVMSLAVLASITGGSIYGAEAVSKSFPDFFEKFSSIGINLKVDEK